MHCEAFLNCDLGQKRPPMLRQVLLHLTAHQLTTTTKKRLIKLGVWSMGQSPYLHHNLNPLLPQDKNTNAVFRGEDEGGVCFGEWWYTKILWNCLYTRVYPWATRVMGKHSKMLNGQNLQRWMYVYFGLPISPVPHTQQTETDIFLLVDRYYTVSLLFLHVRHEDTLKRQP